MNLLFHHGVVVFVPIGSITGSLTTIATNLVSQAGLIGIFVLMLLDCACIPIPSEITMLFAGFSVSQGHYSLVTVVVAGTLGNLAGSVIAYAVGVYGNGLLRGRRVQRLLVHERALDRAQSWFDRYGAASVFVSRMLPIVRTFISLPAGFGRMHFWRFCLFTLLGCIPWVLAWALIGDAVGHNWTNVRDQLRYADYAVVAVAVAIVSWLAVRRVRRNSRPAD